MVVKRKHKIIIFFIGLLTILTNCQLKEPKKIHGINFLENRESLLIVNKTNKNDVIKLIGKPHTTSLEDENRWMYFQRTIVKGKYYNIGKNVLKKNNVLTLEFDKYGILKNKNIISKEDMNKVKISKQKTVNNVSQKSFVNKFLGSIRQKMYGKKKF
jgi:outer membrane protein assembly factor BamE (lipoprotein component of BamABCDE complex)